MNNLKLNLWIIVIVLLVPYTLSLTLQELIDSYSFGYYDGTLNVTNSSDYMLDLNSDGKNDTIMINLTLNVTKTGNYEFFIDLSDDENTISNRINQSVSSGLSYLNLSFQTNLLNKKKYNYSVRVYNESSIMVFSKYDLQTNSYSFYDNGTNLIRITDENLNNNYVRINVTLNSTQTYDTNVTVYLRFNETIISATKQQTLSSGTNIVGVNFDNETIKSTHYSGNYTIEQITVNNKIIPSSYVTRNYNYETFAKTSYLKNYSSSGIDSNLDNISEFLGLNFTINAKNTNSYEIQVEINDEFNNFVRNLSITTSLSSGINVIPAIINGSDIYSTKLSGPYILTSVKLIENGTFIDSQFEPYSITNLTYSDFVRPPLPDLFVQMNASFNQSTNTSIVILNLTNIGNSTAFNVFLDLFNNESFSAQNSTNILEVNASLIFDFTITNTSNFTLFTSVADFDNLVDESDETNNIAQNTESIEVSLTIESLNITYNNGTLKIFEFIILNDGEANVTNIRWQFDTGDGNVINNTKNITSLGINQRAYVYIKYNYSIDDDYTIKANATGFSQSSTLTASYSITTATDLTITSFDDIYTSGKRVIFEIDSQNLLSSNITGINWSINDGQSQILNSTKNFTLQSNETIFILVEHQYSTTGIFSPISTVINSQYSDTATASVTLNLLEITNLTVLNASGDWRMFEFDIQNYLDNNLTNVSWIFDTKNGNVINSTIPIILTPNETILVILPHNFTTGTGPETFNVNSTAKNLSLIDSENLTITV